MMTDETYNYLAYGSNLHPRRIESRLGSVRFVGTVKLQDWALYFHKRGADGSGKGNLIAQEGAVSWGVIYAINQQQKALLDQFEGAGYEQKWLSVSVADQSYNSFIYLAESDWIDNLLLPHDWYQQLIYLGAKNAGFPTDYLQRIQAQSSCHEPDGNQRHAQMLMSMRADIEAQE